MSQTNTPQISDLSDSLQMLQQWKEERMGETADLSEEAIVQEILLRAARADFCCELVSIPLDAGGQAFEPRWSHRGASFVGFRQPPAQPSRELALLAGCASLLNNDWCRTRLTEAPPTREIP